MILVIFGLIILVFVVGLLLPVFSGILEFDPKQSKTFKNKQKMGYKLNIDREDNIKLLTSVKKNITTEDMRDPNVFEYDINELIQEDLMKEERERNILSNLRKRQFKA
ncbi:hypothetical protein QEN19_000697 [Hanseniaspora menglaensis]